jgi:hypothetical protein
MAWIKRNLIFVIGLVAAVAVIGGGVFYLLSAKGRADDASQQLDAENDHYEKLLNREVFPNKENIDATKAEQNRVKDFKGEVQRFFAYPALPPQLDDESFKALLENSVVSLTHLADVRGVKLPAGSGTSGKYDFAFSQQRSQLRFPADSLKPFATQLLDLSDICHILFDAKVHSLVSLKRTAVGTNDAPGSADVLANKKVTRSGVIDANLYPYEVAFQCFSSELADVLNGFVRASTAYNLKTVNVERGQLETTTAAPVAAVSPAYMMNPMMARYGNRYMPQPQVAAAPISKAGEVVLEEKPLKVTISLEVVRLNPPAAPAPAGAKPQARPQRATPPSGN